MCLVQYSRGGSPENARSRLTVANIFPWREEKIRRVSAVTQDRETVSRPLTANSHTDTRTSCTSSRALDLQVKTKWQTTITELAVRLLTSFKLVMFVADNPNFHDTIETRLVSSLLHNQSSSSTNPLSGGRRNERNPNGAQKWLRSRRARVWE